MKVNIKGVLKSSLIDWPGKICSVIFLAKCNFKCPYCHNRDLVGEAWHIKSIEKEKLYDYLKRKKNWIDGVCITGGEPTCSEDLPDFIKSLKKTGVKIKLDTNGANPEMLKEVIEDLNFIAMDVKAPLNKYEDVVRTRFDVKNIKKSIKLIMDSKKNYEFRTTVLPALIDKDDITKICKLIRGANNFVIQQFRPTNTLDKGFERERAYLMNDLERFKEIAMQYVKN